VEAFFSSNTNVSLFETNIRVLGGLLSAHQLAVAYLENQVLVEDVRDSSGVVVIGNIPSKLNMVNDVSKCEAIVNKKDNSCTNRKECALESQIYTEESKALLRLKANCENFTRTAINSENKFWVYDGILLELAHDIGKRLLPAFQTKTGIPYGTVNLINGIPNGESKVASLAGAGTLTLEFELLSRLSGDKSFGDAAKLASRALWMRRTKRNLLGKHINIERGSWTEHLSGIGSNSDSFYEYLVKHYILFPEDEDFWPMFLSSYIGVHNESRLGEWYGDVDMHAGSSGAVRRVFESLMAFYPGMQVLLGELSPAAKTLNGFLMVREAVGLLPERFNYGNWKVEGGGGGLHPLRPELLESCYFLHKSTEGISSKRIEGDFGGISGWLWAADHAVHTINWHTKAKCGFSSITNVSPQTTGGIPMQAQKHYPKKVNEMPSFFLSETLKYLYLIFDEDNILHQDNDREWVFTTEAHPIHHAPLHSSNDKEISMTSQLQNRVYKYLLSRRESKLKQHLNSYAPSNAREKWAEKSTMQDYSRQIEEVESVIPARSNSQVHRIRNGYELLGIDFVKPFFLPIDKDEYSASQQDTSNIAHLSLAPNGMSSQNMAIIKGCPNVYSPSLSWINALSGGATDYANIYVSTVHDEIPVDTKHGVGLLSASHALALYGSGLFLGKVSDNDRESCPVDPNHASTSAKHKESNNKAHTQRFDMGGGLGAFDVSMSAEGNGFTIEQVKSGESIVVIVVQNELIGQDNDNEVDAPYVMVYSTTPDNQKKRNTSRKKSLPSSSWFPGMNWKTVFTHSSQSLDGRSETDDSRVTRSVVIGDGSGFAFSCAIQVVSRSVVDLRPLAKNDQVHPIEVETIIKNLPCAPALFGPTLIPRLVKTSGITVEGELTLPDEGNEMGCAEANNLFESPNPSKIHLVQRGICTFQSKAIRQHQAGAKGVIVINSEAHDLFLMANGTESNQKEKEEDLPVSTLVSGKDGLDLISMVKASAPANVIAKIALLPHNGAFYQKKKVNKNQPMFPILHASSEAIQIFSSGGWGVHAVDGRGDKATRSSIGENGNKKEWQLFLLQHSHSEDNESN